MKCIKRVWNIVRTRAKIENCRWHDLRHTFGAHLAMQNIPLNKIGSFMGHSDPKMTQRYAKLLPSDMADDIGKISL